MLQYLLAIHTAQHIHVRTYLLWGAAIVVGQEEVLGDSQPHTPQHTVYIPVLGTSHTASRTRRSAVRRPTTFILA